METVQQLCIESIRLEYENGDYLKIKQGKKYTTTVPNALDVITLFDKFWVNVPKKNFILSENQKRGLNES